MNLGLASSYVDLSNVVGIASCFVVREIAVRMHFRLNDRYWLVFFLIAGWLFGQSLHRSAIHQSRDGRDGTVCRCESEAFIN